MALGRLDFINHDAFIEKAFDHASFGFRAEAYQTLYRKHTGAGIDFANMLSFAAEVLMGVE
ncbi:hypothetical protein BTJ40_02360 [Microbulbifer sp. A4B17]|nr:hypothetical protein BTJ40_02360 [Microbulbifer sp. A4B17]